MNIGFSFYGSIYGKAANRSKDVRHCWPNLKRMLIDPFVEQGHSAKILFSCYDPGDEEVESQFLSLVKPDLVLYSDFANSNGFTCKEAAFDNFENDESLDIIVTCRSDMHFRKKIAEENIDTSKFNFLFPELGNFTNNGFTTDNFYLFPQSMSKQVRKAMLETYCFPRGFPYVDTHALMVKLKNHIDESQIHFISNKEELSDVNSFYTLCREELFSSDYLYDEEGLKLKRQYLDRDVAERFSYKI